jgi:hypothetical protein
MRTFRHPSVPYNFPGTNFLHTPLLYNTLSVLTLQSPPPPRSEILIGTYITPWFELLNVYHILFILNTQSCPSDSVRALSDH